VGSISAHNYVSSCKLSDPKVGTNYLDVFLSVEESMIISCTLFQFVIL